MTCETGKIVYETPQGAWIAARAIGHRQRDGIGGSRTRSGTAKRGGARGYRCPMCGYWHVTSDVSRKGNR